MEFTDQSKLTDNKREGFNKLLPSDFYYNEYGLFVFTESYHARRGYCCGSGCVNCPFIPHSKKGNTILEN